MFDLWYATGAVVMFPEILDEISTKGDAAGVAAGRTAGAPLFFHVPTIQFCDGQNPNAPLQNPNSNGAAAVPVIRDSGFVVADILEDVRTAVKDAVHKWFPFAPPISLYTAGKFCQILTVAAFDFRNNVKVANQGYAAAVKHLPAKRSPNFPAFLGVLFMDAGLSATLSGAAGSATVAKQALAEFQITDAGEVSAFQTLAKPGNFLVAQSNLLGNASPSQPTWTTCREQFIAWSPRTDAMVI
jgi:hypothetical protein